MQSKKVIFKNTGTCPVCGATHFLDPSADTFERIGENQIVFDRKCLECGSSWKDVFTLERRNIDYNGVYNRAMNYWADLIRNSPSGEEMDELVDKLLMACPGGNVRDIMFYLDRNGFETNPQDTARAFFGHNFEQVEAALLDQHRQNNSYLGIKDLSVYFSRIEDKDLEKESVEVLVEFLTRDQGIFQRVATGQVQITRRGQLHGFRESDKVNPLVEPEDLPRRE